MPSSGYKISRHKGSIYRYGRALGILNIIFSSLSIKLRLYNTKVYMGYIEVKGVMTSLSRWLPQQVNESGTHLVSIHLWCYTMESDTVARI